jgi:hypothetical protein
MVQEEYEGNREQGCVRAGCLMVKLGNDGA